MFGKDWSGAKGLAEDVRYYGQWMRDQAFKRIGHLYPRAEITEDMVKGRSDLKGMAGQKLTVIAWIWARTVKSPNPAYSHVDVPLVKSFVLSSKKNKETWLKTIVEDDAYRFEVKTGSIPQEAKNGTKLSRGANFQCLVSGSPIEPKYIKAEGMVGRMGQRMLAIVAEGRRGRIYLPATEEMETIPKTVEPSWKPKGKVPRKLTGGTCAGYGLDEWSKLFTPRQLLALNTFSDLVIEAREKVIEDAKNNGFSDDGIGFNDGGKGATAYGDAIATYLGLALSRSTNTINSLAVWSQSREQSVNLFSRQAIPMAWDFPEVNPFAGAAGDFGLTVSSMGKSLNCVNTCDCEGISHQLDAQSQTISKNKIISTDPPYYDNVGYADLSDFFYVWLRRSLMIIFPDPFSTMITPKSDELVATPYRHGNKEKAEQFFMDGMSYAIRNLSEQANAAFPVTIYYLESQKFFVA